MRSLQVVILLVLATVARAQPHIVRMPWYETSVDSNALTLSWTTDSAADCVLRYGEADSGTIREVSGGSGRAHTVVLTNLHPSTTYRVQLFAVDAEGSDTVQFYSSTASGEQSPGTVDVYFNRWIDTNRYPLSEHAHASSDLLGMLKHEIDRAEHSIDLAVYSFSGKTGNTVRSWLREAMARGIHVRIIADSGAIRNSSSFSGLGADGIPAITNAFGATGDSWSNIHHNKFIVIDGRGGHGSTAGVVTGSWNLSDQQTTTDYQNVLTIQDEALARTYEREFDEEWGSATDTPDSLHSRFSYRKSDNTARSFNIKGTTVHLFFSPNGGIADALQAQIDSARSLVLFAMYQFTSDALAHRLEEAHLSGLGVHGIIGADGASDVYDDLVAHSVDVVHFSGYQTLDSLFHHKFSIVDPGLSTAVVTTGSYNWTISAETRNNENEVILMSPELARDYFSEWIMRYRENGGAESISLPAYVSSNVNPEAIMVYPNPSRGPIHVRWSMQEVGKARIVISDAIGAERLSISSVVTHGSNEIVLSPALPRGAYLLRIEHDGRLDTTPIIITH